MEKFKMKNIQPKKRTILIVLAGANWLDLSNDTFIGNAEALIEYVNDWNIVVANDDCFLRSNEFWYNKEK